MDTQLCRRDATYNALPDINFAWSHGVQYNLAIDIEVYANFVALDLVTQMDLKMEPHPHPYILDDHEFVQYRCKLYFRVKSYEEKVWCDVVNL